MRALNACCELNTDDCLSMDAPLTRLSVVLMSLLVLTGAKHRSPNFVVTASTPEQAKKVAVAAESYRRDLAIYWLGRALPNWSRPCSIRVRAGKLAAAGETRFQFVRGEVLNWNMVVIGTEERILDSVLPHEVNHTIFASHYRRPLPRWADEGAATLFEHRSEQLKQLGLLNKVINSQREFISLRNLLVMKEYPKQHRAMLIMYAEGYALADFLVQQGGQERYLRFLADGDKIGWTEAIRRHYHHGGVDKLEKNWKGWVLAGMPKLNDPRESLLAARENVTDNVEKALGISKPAILKGADSKATLRLQSPDGGMANRSFDTRNAQPAFSRGRQVSGQTAGRFRQISSFERGRGYSGFTPTTTGQMNSPSARPSFQGSPTIRPARQANFEAPIPKYSIKPSRDFDKDTNQPVQESSASQPGRRISGLDRSDLQFTTSQRKHLPQERKAVSGSTPQWAGFPGQMELF